MTRQKLTELMAATSRTLTLDDFDLIAELDDAARRVVNPYDDAASFLLSIPVPCGNRKLRPLTVAMMAWYNQVGREMCEGTDIADTVVGWLMDSETDSRRVASMGGVDEVRKAVREWERGAHFTVDELAAAVRKVTGEGSGEGSADFGPLIAVLMREYGATPDYWLHDADVSVIETLCEEIGKRVDAEDAAMRKAASKSGTTLPPAMTAKIRALDDFRKIAKRIEEQWLEN